MLCGAIYPSGRPPGLIVLDRVFTLLEGRFFLLVGLLRGLCGLVVGIGLAVAFFGIFLYGLWSILAIGRFDCSVEQRGELLKASCRIPFGESFEPYAGVLVKTGFRNQVFHFERPLLTPVEINPYFHCCDKKLE